jgi:outer membrane biosynthesis protein TonB
MLRRFLLVFVLAPVLLAATGNSPSNCCTSDDQRVSQKQVNVLLDKTEPIQTPCCGQGLHIEGTIVLAIRVDSNGEVTCVKVVSGHPLVIGSTIDSIRRWKFRSLVMNGIKKSFCGRVAIRYAATDYAVKYEVIRLT